LTFQVIGWADVFSRKVYRDLFWKILLTLEMKRVCIYMAF
jgi:hypothetical protein